MTGETKTYESYEDMYKRHYQMVFGYARRMILNNEAAVEDVTQEVFFLAYKKWDILQEHPNVPGFLMLTAQNKIKKWYEKQSRVYVDDPDSMEIIFNDKKKGVGTEEYNMIDLYSSMENTLSNKDINILRHYYEYGYTSSEMAKKLGITESCFKVRVARMKEKLRRSIKMLWPFLILLGVELWW